MMESFRNTLKPSGTGRRSRLFAFASVAAFAVSLAAACRQAPPPWEADNPVVPLPAAPLGTNIDLTKLPDPPTPERVRLGRWLFYDSRLSADGTVSCATCHQPEHAFSMTTAVATGIRGQKGTRKAPTIINRAATLSPFFFWDGRAGSLEDQAMGPVANPIEMGNTHSDMIATLSRIDGYKPYFAQAFGTPDITKDRVARALSDYERTRMSGNSPYDRWRLLKQQDAVSPAAKRGWQLFFDKAGCSQCHVSGNNFTDTAFHNIGIGWNEATKSFSDEGRYAVVKGTIDEGFAESDRGAFKTPTLRDVARHPPYMHDGSIATLREVVEYYNRGGNKNPYLAPKMPKGKLGLTPDEVDALVAFLEALNGEGYADTAPRSFPR